MVSNKRVSFYGVAFSASQEHPLPLRAFHSNSPDGDEKRSKPFVTTFDLFFSLEDC